MILDIEEYIVHFIFSRVDLKFTFLKEGTSRTIKVDNITIVIPKISRSNKPLTKDILGHEISYYRYNTNLDFQKNNEVITFNYDLIGETLDHLTLKRESSDSFNFNDLEVFLPVLDMKIFAFFSELQEYLNFEFKKFNNKSFALGVSHDIDRTGDSYRYRVITHFFQTLKQKRPLLLLKGLFGKNEEFNFEEILEIESSYEAKSTWFILSHYGLKQNADYKLTSKWYKKGIEILIEKKSEIGLHIPFMDLSVDAINNEFEKLPKNSKTGVRMHHLRGEYKELMQFFNTSKVSYDSTFGFNEVISYRFGTSNPFNPILEDLGSFEMMENVTELPMNIMDIQVTDLEVFKDQLTTLFDVLEKVGGVCVINWHNNRFNRTKYGSIWVDSFKLVLQEAKNRNAFIGSLDEIVQSYKVN